MTNKKQVPAAVHFQTTGQLQPIDYNWLHILHVCREALQQEKQYVILPVEEKQNDKRNKMRLVKGDKNSPRGLVMKTDREALQRYYPYAAVRLDAEELSTYAAKRFNELDPAELERMASELTQQS